MGAITVKDSLGPPLTERDIAAIEREFGVSLPGDYRAFLRKHNGGSPSPDAFPIFRDSADTHGILNRFLGISPGDYDDMLAVRKVFQERVPPDLLPIACDPGGNLICLAVAGTNRRRIYFWDHEEEADEGEPPTYDNVYFVAESFTDLLNNLTELPENAD